MSEIVLTTLNAKYIHAAFGLRYLLANLGDLQSRAKIVEFEIHTSPHEIAERLLELDPKIIGLGVYIWNVKPVSETVSILKKIRPGLIIVLGGPEVSYEIDQQPIAKLADYIIGGEADLAFPTLCRDLLEGRKPPMKFIQAAVPVLADVAFPYEFYRDEDVATRIIYVEVSRGCPFTCEFCLSSLDIPVRQFALDPFLDAMRKLLDRGVRQFKFVDRTFNLNIESSRRILQFFLEASRPGLFVHFEMIPDRLPLALRAIIEKFPPGALQFEVGIQTFNPEVARLISRRQDYNRLADNLQFLRSQTGVHVHADLIVGLPGESLESFGSGFDRLVALGPQEIQVGILKRLRGTPIIRHDAEFAMKYAEEPPYEILQTSLISFSEMQKVRRFARFWDLIANSGNFVSTSALVWEGNGSPFRSFWALAEWMFERLGRHHSVALDRLAELLFEFLTNHGMGSSRVAGALAGDFRGRSTSDLPVFLRSHLPESVWRATRVTPARGVLPKRQRRRVA